MGRLRSWAPAAALAALAAGCAGGTRGVAGLDIPPTFARAEEAFLSGDYARAKGLFVRFKDTRGSDPFVPWAHYWAGKCDLQQGNTRSAKLNFSRAVASQLGPDLEAAALLGLGDACYNEKNYSQALGYYRRVASPRLSGRVRAEEVQFKLGMCQKELGRTRTADKHFERVTKAGPEGEYASLATKMRSAPPAASARAAAASRLAPGGWDVQAGVFSRREGASDLQRRLRSGGFRSSLTSERKAGSVYYSVRVGRPSSEAAAKETARRLSAAGFQCVVKQ